MGNHFFSCISGLTAAPLSIWQASEAETYQLPDLLASAVGCLLDLSGRLMMVAEPQIHASDAAFDERWNTLAELDEWLRIPMLVLSFLWLLLVVVELIWGAFDALETFGTAVWVTFLIEFALRFTLAPEKAAFVGRNWLTVIALIIPAFRLFRAFRILKSCPRCPRSPARPHRGNGKPRYECPHTNRR